MTFQTAVAQAELEDRPVEGAFHRYGFTPVSRLRLRRRLFRLRKSAPCRLSGSGDGAVVLVDTTRPELLPACVALVANPADERYQPLFGTTVRSPLFDVEVPVLAHELAQPDKGTGIAMICTFGDTTDVTWWRELQLPTRVIVERNGRLRADVPDWITSPAGRARYGELAGKTVRQAQTKIVEQLRAAGALVGEPDTDHPPGQVLREGRPAPGDRVLPPVVHPKRRPGRQPA